MFSAGKASIAQRIAPHGEHSDCSNRKKNRKTMQYTEKKTHGKLNNIHTAQYATLLTPYEKIMTYRVELIEMVHQFQQNKNYNKV
jgi:hypothetical protein